MSEKINRVTRFATVLARKGTCFRSKTGTLGKIVDVVNHGAAGDRVTIERTYPPKKGSKTPFTQNDETWAAALANTVEEIVPLEVYEQHKALVMTPPPATAEEAEVAIARLEARLFKALEELSKMHNDLDDLKKSLRK